jgi:diadenosine tetraphosphatase ApaH/serine/threonine PP2A family protein phosphatase
MSEERETYTATPALDLDAIEARANASGKPSDNTQLFVHANGDVPALVAEVRRLRAEIGEHDRWKQMAIDHAGDLECRLMEGYAEARTLFLSMKQRHYPDSEAVPNQTTAGVVLQISNMAAGLSDKIDSLRADVERLGRERDDMARANAELQERLSACEDDGK